MGQREVLSYLENNPGFRLTCGDISKGLNQPASVVSKVLKRLRKQSITGFDFEFVEEGMFRSYFYTMEVVL